MTLIDNWRDFHKFWSVRFHALGVTVLALLEIFPHEFIAIWNSLPSEVVDNFPPGLVKWVGYSCLVAGILSRGIKQAKLRRAADREAAS